MGSFKVLYCKLPTISKKLSYFPYKVRGLNQRPQRWVGVCYHCATVAPSKFWYKYPTCSSVVLMEAVFNQEEKLNIYSAAIDPIFNRTEISLSILVSLSFIWDFMSLSTLYRSYHDG